MAWDAVMDRLLDLFSGLYPTANAAAGIAQRAQVPTRFVDFNGPAVDFWMSILNQAKLREKLPGLIEKATSDYPEVDFPALALLTEQPTPRAPRLNPDQWKGPDIAGGNLEKVMGTQPTFLPIRFLEVGIQRARAVVRVVTPKGNGSGFLIRDNLLITNHHVIPSEEVARQSQIEFNYQETAAGLAAPVSTFSLDPAAGFATSPEVEGDDWTAVRVAGNPQAEWETLELVEAEVQASDCVNIIQHPGGLPKQIALYHNVVAFADDRRVQYLTDTLPGSSGSPVFDSAWKIVALHHSGGWLTEPTSKRVFFRNEGIHINVVIRGLTASTLQAPAPA